MLKKTCLLIHSVTSSCRFVFLIIFDMFFWFSTVGMLICLLINYNVISSWHGNLPC